jgi:hypothetical protein
MKFLYDLVSVPHTQKAVNKSKETDNGPRQNGSVGQEAKPEPGAAVTTNLNEPEKLPRPNEFVDEKAMLKQSKFPIKPDALIARTKEVLIAFNDVHNPDLEKLFSDDFVMCAPFVGGATNATPDDPKPGISKTKMFDALRGFKLLDAFPDLNNNYHAFRVDPFEPNRVWYQTRPFGTHTGAMMGKEPTGRRLELPPQAFSMTFNETGLVTRLSIGYVIDRTVGNTGGLGGVFGHFYGIGHPLPIPECKPYKPSWQFSTLNWLRDKMEQLGYV